MTWNDDGMAWHDGYLQGGINGEGIWSMALTLFWIGSIPGMNMLTLHLLF